MSDHKVEASFHPGGQEPTDDELADLHYEGARIDMGGREWDAYDGVMPMGLRLVWRAGFNAGREQ